MKEEAKKQYAPISVAQVKETLRKIAPEKFEKMIITEGQAIKRGNYVFAKLKYQKVVREVKKIKFPLYASVKESFSLLEGGEVKHGEKAYVKSNHVFETLEHTYKIKSYGLDSHGIKEPYKFALDVTGNEINANQLYYFFPAQTYQETCDECKGEKYITCGHHECKGQHEWTCTDCTGKGKVACSDCSGSGKLGCNDCSGHGYVKCAKGVGAIIGIASGCGGSGKVEDKREKNTADETKQMVNCPKCSGRGEVPCKDCSTEGKVSCKRCTGSGEVQCKVCTGHGTLKCSICYGDKERYGKVDCPQCKTVGTMAQIVYVETLVSENESEMIIPEGAKLNVANNTIHAHVNTEIKTELIFQKANDFLKESYDEYSKVYSAEFEKGLGLSKDEFPSLTKKEMYYQVVPCVEVSYKHILTGKMHEFTIVDFWNRPEIIFHSDAEDLKGDFGNASKAVGGFFGKLFKTKGHKTKEDKHNEIILLIHLAKCDGKIEDPEKIYLSEMIGGLEDFTNGERQELFDVMNATHMLPLTRDDVKFSSTERAQEVVSKLTELAKADGEMSEAEKALIEKIRALM